MDNEERASKAYDAVMTHAELSGQAHDGVLDNADDEEAIGDLLVNLRHLADQHGLIWDHLVGRADMHYSAEIDGDDEDEDEDEDNENACPFCGGTFDDPPPLACDLYEAHANPKRDAKPGPVMTVGDHRQSMDGPFINGPFPTYGAAREFAVEQYLSGEWDPHGYTFVYRETS